MATNSYTLLEKGISSELGIKNQPTFNGQAVSFFATSSFVYTLLFMAIVAASFYRYVLAGIWRMEASESGIRKSNEEFKRVTLGLLGVFSLFLILFTLNKDLLRGNVGLEALAKDPNVERADQAAASVSEQKTKSTVASAPSIPKNNDDGVGWDAIKNDTGVRSRLSSFPNGGVQVNKKVCTNPTQTSCTTVGGWPEETIAMLLQLRNTCSGSIVVSGGTEAGHSSHGPGKAPVDLSLSSPGGLEGCIRSFPKSSRTPKRGNGADLCFPGQVFEKFGYVFCDEAGSDRHWHVYK